MNFGEMQEQVFLVLNENQSSPTYWTEDDVKKALNDGYAELSDETEWYERYSTVSMLSGRTYLDLRGVLPHTLLAPRRNINNQTGRWMLPVNVSDLDYRAYVQWERSKGEPQNFFMRGLWWMGFFMQPTQDGGTVRLTYSSIPDEMVDDEFSPQFHEEYHWAIVYYAIYDLFCQDAETDKAMYWWNQYVKVQDDFKKYVQQRVETSAPGAWRESPMITRIGW
jgi:hypothetical protein